MNNKKIWMVIISAVCLSLISCSEFYGSEFYSNELLADFKRADKLSKQGKFEEAIQEYERFINKWPDFEYAYQSLGYIYQYELEDSPKAIQAYSKGLDKFPSNYLMNLSIMYAYFGLKNIEKGVQYYELLAKLMSEDRYYSFPREIVDVMTKDMKEKEKLLFCEKYLSMNPTDRGLRENLVNIYKSQGEYKKAKHELEIMLKRGDKTGYIHFDLGTCHYNLGHLQKALECFLKAKQSGQTVPKEFFQKIERELKEKASKAQ